MKFYAFSIRRDAEGIKTNINIEDSSIFVDDNLEKQFNEKNADCLTVSYPDTNTISRIFRDEKLFQAFIDAFNTGLFINNIFDDLENGIDIYNCAVGNS